jgi:uncharacterized repeat protein (TIGR03803 family)
VNGILYGTTDDEGGGYGSVYRVNADGTGYTQLKVFEEGESFAPNGRLCLSGDTLYGMTSVGGAFDNGAIFKLKTDGSGFKVIFNLPAKLGPPAGGVVLCGHTLYGNLGAWNESREGKIFRVNTDGTGFAILRKFNELDELLPLGDFIVSGGALCGTSALGGEMNEGVIFSIDIPPFCDGLESVNGTNIVRFGGVPGQSYFIQSCASLASAQWQNLGSRTADAEGRFEFAESQPSGSVARYYRAERK